MKQNNKNEKKEKTKPNQVLADIIKVLDLDEAEIKIEEEKKGTNNTIKNILEENKENVNYKDAVIIAIKESSNNFIYIDKNLKKDPSIAREMIKTFAREGKNYIEVKEFIEENFPKEEKKLFKLYKQQLKKINEVVKDDLTKNLFKLKENDSVFYNLLIEKKVIISKGKITTIDKNFIISLEKFFINNEEYKKADLEGKKILKYNYLILLLGVDNNKLTNESIFILNSIIQLCILKQDKVELDKDIQKEKKKTDTVKKDYEDIGELDTADEEDIFSDRLENCLPSCSYYYSSSGYYTITTADNMNVKISENEKNNFTSEALKNFVKFYHNLHKLGLNFLWDKYKNQFSTLIGNKCGVNYLYGEGITDSKTLSVLNLIGKNIGIPETEIIGNDGKKTTEIKCFKTLGEAELRFGEIKSTSMINGEMIETTMGTSAVEKKLHLNGKIDIIKGELLLSSW